MLVTILFTGIPVAARAQILERYYPTGIPGYQTWFSDAVLERPRSEYDSLGVRAGDFTIRPSLSESLGYDSNILGSTPAVSSPLARTQGAVGVASNWARNALVANVGFDNVRYLDQPHVSYTDWTASIGGTIDVGRDQISLAYSHFTSTVLPTAIGTLGLNQPVTYNLDDARVSYTAHFGRVTLVPAFEVGIYRFDNGPLGGQAANEASNNRNVFTGTLTAGYELAPARSLVLVASGSNANYTTKTLGVPTPNFNDGSLLGGIDYRISGPVRFRALVGYEQRSYVSGQLSTISSPVAELDVIWTPTQLTTVTGRVSRSIESAVTAGSDGYTYTEGRLVVDHEYLRNVLLQGYAQIERADYQQGGEKQTVVSAGASVTWLLNRRLRLIGRYGFQETTDNVNSSLNATSNLGELELAFQL